MIFDSALESTKMVSYVATNNYHGGVLAAQRLGELLKGEGKVILLRYAVGSESTEQREKGFTDTLAKEFPGITLLSDTEYAGPDFRLGPAEGAEPGDALPRAGRRDLLPQRVEHVRDAAGPRRGGDAGQSGRDAAGKRRSRAPGNARRQQVVRGDAGARRRLAGASTRAKSAP